MNRAELLPPETSPYTGRTRRRCVPCGKVAFPNEDAGRGAARRISERTPMRAYRGRCGWWHVTRTGRRRPPRVRTHRDRWWAVMLADPRAVR